jgi:hypothetical protein
VTHKEKLASRDPNIWIRDSHNAWTIDDTYALIDELVAEGMPRHLARRQANADIRARRLKDKP